MNTLVELNAIIEYIRTDVRTSYKAPAFTATAEDLKKISNEIDEFMASRSAA